ncbi:transposase [Bradyrhizobium liaoningense]|uniref:transposase n=1 Tax=Bradyrhizobium liaoningense TaxID=43992 RepID=UPI003908B0C1
MVPSTGSWSAAIKELQRHRFGRKAETLPGEQMLLGVEDIQQIAAQTEAGCLRAPTEAVLERKPEWRARPDLSARPAHRSTDEALIPDLAKQQHPFGLCGVQ